MAFSESKRPNKKPTLEQLEDECGATGNIELYKSLAALFGETNLAWFLVGEKPGQKCRGWFLGLILLRKDEEGLWECIIMFSWEAGEGFSMVEQPKWPCPVWGLFESRQG